jgi:hypothetical protein
MGDVASWRTKRVGVGVPLLVVAVLGTFLGIQGGLSGDGAGSGVGLATVMTVLASLVIGLFGVRYLMLGLRGSPVRLYERALEADLFGKSFLLPQRRLVSLLRIEVSGTARLTKAFAISGTGHAFSLPGAFVEEADLWYLGSLGKRPLAPGGRAAKDRFEAGELNRYERDQPAEIPDHGPPWPPVPPLPKDIIIGAETGEVEPEVPKAPTMPPPIPEAPVVEGAAEPPSPEARGAIPIPAPPSELEAAPTSPPVAPGIPPSADRLEELPEEPMPPPEKAPTFVAPPEITIPKRDVRPPTPPPEEPAAGTVDDWELEEVPPPTRSPEVSSNGDETSDWELEEMPPPSSISADEGDEEPEQDKGDGWDWEEL